MSSLSSVGSSVGLFQSQRFLPGTSRADLAAFDACIRAAPDPPAFDSFQGTFATQEYLQATIKYDPSAIERIITLPPQHDPSVWQYESLRQILLELSSFINELGCAPGDPGSSRAPCTASSCPKMCATDQWVFLCAAHPAEPGKKMAPKECCAMDWMLHTLAGFNALMNSTDDFPNRYTISAKSTRHFSDMGRRLYRVFAHAFYHHREMFDEIESRTHLTERFMAFCLHFELMKAAQLEPPIQIKPREAS